VSYFQEDPWNHFQV